MKVYMLTFEKRNDIAPMIYAKRSLAELHGQMHGPHRVDEYEVCDQDPLAMALRAMANYSGA